MYTNNLIQNEYDIILETQNKGIYLIEDTKEMLQKSNLNEIDKEYILSNIYLQINNILNTAFNNKTLFDYLSPKNIKDNNLPENYIKPDKQYMDLLKMAYSMTNEQFATLLQKAKEIIK